MMVNREKKNIMPEEYKSEYEIDKKYGKH
ncbi:hypothetical protein RTO_11500 [[Ruminococcus] torques L2-14]|uniref:Uncharacterized protein n=1 Tax=[Ruminococcus] torques L2-14 TaxID=657313 RepID=D4M3K5_9FIRM|nr:hypothetical protein RTO_11500 [[Ruminococcus] torques L2-14]